MAAELQTLHMWIDADARLAAAAGGVAHFLGDAAGLENDAATRLQSAVVEACKEAFEQLAPQDGHLEITFARFSDRLEVSLSHEDCAAPAAASRTISGFNAKNVEAKQNSASPTGVDRVQHETHGSECVTRLTKYLGKVAPSL